jgi:hypothetical protein
MSSQPYPQDHRPKYDPVFSKLAEAWSNQIKAAKEHKKKTFGTQASEIMSFYNGPKDWAELMNPGRDMNIPTPSFSVSINKAWEFVSIYTPAINFELPVRTVKARMPVEIPPDLLGIDPNDPQWLQLNAEEQIKVRHDGLRATLLSMYLNWTPKEYGLESESRKTVHEGLLKGRSCGWTELYQPANSDFKVVRTTWLTVDDLLVDPDAPSLNEAQWIARRCVHPVWEVERLYGLRPGMIHANAESKESRADDTDPGSVDRIRRGESNDLIEYYQIYSKMGIGGRLRCEGKSDNRESLEVFGDYCLVVVAPDHNFLLNLNPELIAADEAGDQDATNMIFSRTAWPTPYWKLGKFPVTVMDFGEIPNSVWPMSPLTPAKGELRFLNWAYSYLLGHIKTSSRDFIAVKKGANDSIKAAVVSGEDLEVIEIEYDGSISDIVQFLQHPQMNKDIWPVIKDVEELFNKRVGLTELMYGSTGVQLRSATEADTKQQNASVRPEDMAKRVEVFHTEIAIKEAVACRFHLTADDVRQVVGDLGASVWQEFVSTSDPEIAGRQLQYTVEAGSTRRPNKNAEQKQMTEAMQVLLPVFQGYGQMTGDQGPLNNLLSDFAKSRDLDPARYVLGGLLPPPPAQPVGGPDAAQQQPTANPGTPQ